MYKQLVVCLAIVFAFAKKQEQPTYTEDITVWTSDRKPHRMQILAGCWLVAVDELDRLSKDLNVTIPAQNITNNSYPIDAKLMGMIKKCIKSVTLKEAVNKVAALVDKNLTVPKSFMEVVGAFSESDIVQQFNEFDHYLSAILTNFTSELASMRKGNIKDLMQSELKKKTKYFFGFIPANFFTKTTMIVLLTGLMVSCCTCWKYYKRAGEKREERKDKIRDQREKKNFNSKKSSKRNEMDAVAAGASPGILPLKSKRN